MAVNKRAKVSSQESQYSTILPQTLEEDYPIEEEYYTRSQKTPYLPHVYSHNQQGLTKYDKGYPSTKDYFYKFTNNNDNKQMQYSIQQSSITKTQQIHCQNTQAAGQSH
jgi:hypothetical protein